MELFLWGFNFADIFCGLGYLSSVKTAVLFMQPGWFLFKMSKKTRLYGLVAKQCTTLWAVWSLTESPSLMNFLTSAPLSSPFFCTWFQDALFRVSSLGSCASILSMWGTGCTWASTTSFIEIHSSDQKVPLMFLYWNINCKVTQQYNPLVVVIFKAYPDAS